MAEKKAAAKQPAKDAPVQFKLEGKTYQMLIPSINIPGKGVLSALDVASDEEAQKAIIEAKAIGSVVKEIFEETPAQDAPPAE